jgi:hypothetical protein
MSCEVANSPFSDPGFPNPFDNNTDHDGDNVDLSALTAFDPNSFSAGIDQSCVDPNTLSNHAGSGSPANPFDPTLTPDFTTDIYPPDFHAIQPSPYFQSIEHQQQQQHQHQQPFGAPFIPSALRNQHHAGNHRRSVSEPPGSALMHHGGQGGHFPPSNAPVIFHRDGHKLGVPRAMVVPMVKKGKQNRAAPYQQRTARQSQTQQQQQQQQQQQHQQPQPQPQPPRYQLRLGYTQQQQHSPVQRPPTSAPHNLSPGPLNHSPQQRMHQPQAMHPHQLQQQQQQQQQQHQQQQHMPPPFDQMQPHQHPQQQQQEPQYVSSRVCTPAPEAVDPFLGGLPPTPTTTSAPAFNHLGGGGGGNVTTQQQQSSPENLVVVKMGVDELRALITDVVQKAVEGLRGAAAAEGDGIDKTAADGVEADGGGVAAAAAGFSDKAGGFQRERESVDGDGDEIVVAGRFTAAGAGGADDRDHGFGPMKEE